MASKTRTLTALVEPSDRKELTLSALYERYVPYVAKLGMRLLGRSEDVDDLIQDVFVAAAERLPFLNDTGAVRGWLASITVRLALRRLRRRRVLRLLSLDTGTFEEGPVALAASHGASAEFGVLLAQVFRILDGVPTADRLAWSLRVLAEEPLESVAALCRCSLSTAKRRIAAAQAVLDRELGS